MKKLNVAKLGMGLYYIGMVALIVPAILAMAVPAALYYSSEWLKRHRHNRTTHT